MSNRMILPDLGSVRSDGSDRPDRHRGGVKKPKTLPRIRVAAIIMRGRSILLARHERDGTSYWLLPGGGVDYGETLEAALVRELKEEASLDIRVQRLVLVNDSIPPDQHRHIVNVCFTAEIIGGKLAVGQDDTRLVDMKFVSIARLPRLTFYPDIRETLVRSLDEDFSNAPGYLGNLWRD